MTRTRLIWSMHGALWAGMIGGALADVMGLFTFALTMGVVSLLINYIAYRMLPEVSR